MFPEHADWGLYFPEATGSRQSPIDLVSCDARYEDLLANTPLQFNYATSRETDILNNGYTLVVFPRAKQGMGKPADSGTSSFFLMKI
jgi:carbonic anhydrase